MHTGTHTLVMVTKGTLEGWAANRAVQGLRVGLPLVLAPPPWPEEAGPPGKGRRACESQGDWRALGAWEARPRAAPSWGLYLPLPRGDVRPGRSRAEWLPLRSVQLTHGPS